MSVQCPNVDQHISNPSVSNQDDFLHVLIEQKACDHIVAPGNSNDHPVPLQLLSARATSLAEPLNAPVILPLSTSRSVSSLPIVSGCSALSSSGCHSSPSLSLSDESKFPLFEPNHCAEIAVARQLKDAVCHSVCRDSHTQGESGGSCERSPNNNFANACYSAQSQKNINSDFGWPDNDPRHRVCSTEHCARDDGAGSTAASGRVPGSGICRCDSGDLVSAVMRSCVTGSSTSPCCEGLDEVSRSVDPELVSEVGTSLPSLDTANWVDRSSHVPQSALACVCPHATDYCIARCDSSLSLCSSRSVALLAEREAAVAPRDSTCTSLCTYVECDTDSVLRVSSVSTETAGSRRRQWCQSSHQSRQSSLNSGARRSCVAVRALSDSPITLTVIGLRSGEPRIYVSGAGCRGGASADSDEADAVMRSMECGDSGAPLVNQSSAGNSPRARSGHTASRNRTASGASKNKLLWCCANLVCCFLG